MWVTFALHMGRERKKKTFKKKDSSLDFEGARRKVQFKKGKKNTVSCKIFSPFSSLIASSAWRGTRVGATYRCAILQDANICAAGHRYSRRLLAFPSLHPLARRRSRRCRCCCCRTRSPRWMLPLRHRGAVEGWGACVCVWRGGEGGVLVKKEEAVCS